MLKIDNLNISYLGVPIVRDASLNINKGEIIGIVGESGSGKSTLLRAIMDILGDEGEIDSGSIIFEGKDITKKENQNIYGKDISMVFQQATLYLDPITTIEKQFLEIMKDSKKSKDEKHNEIVSLLKSLHLEDGERILKSYPFELSGGINQRVSLGLAMINKPKLILADEPTSALDVTVQAQVVQTLKELRDNFDTSIIMVTHNMGVVANIADIIGVMYYGHLVEIGPKREILKNPRHQYTKELLEAVPNLKGDIPKGIAGRIPEFGSIIEGCPFYDRCSVCEPRCKTTKPTLTEVDDNYFTSCLKAIDESNYGELYGIRC